MSSTSSRIESIIDSKTNGQRKKFKSQVRDLGVNRFIIESYQYHKALDISMNDWSELIMYYFR